MLTRQHYLWMCVLSFSPISQPSLPKATALPTSLLLKLFIHFIQLCIQLTVTACHVCAGDQGRKCEWERQFSLVVEMLKSGLVSGAELLGLTLASSLIS